MTLVHEITKREIYADRERSKDKATISTTEIAKLSLNVHGVPFI